MVTVKDASFTAELGCSQSFSSWASDAFIAAVNIIKAVTSIKTTYSNITDTPTKEIHHLCSDSADKDC